MTHPSNSERTSIRRKITTALATAIVPAVIAVAAMPAGASKPTSAKALAKDLLPISYAHAAGFPTVVRKVSTSSHTGLKSCPNGAQVTFTNASGQMALASEVLACTSDEAAIALLKGSSGTSIVTTLPKGLGSSANEHSIGRAIYEITWRRGMMVEAVALNINVSASAGSSTKTKVSALPITSDQQNVLSNAAVAQDAQLKSTSKGH